MNVFVTGGHGFLGSHVVDELHARGHEVTAPPRTELDLMGPYAIADILFMRPDVIVHTAAAVGGIGANVAEPGRFFYDNLMMGVNLLHEISRWRPETKVVTIGTACMYPADGLAILNEGDLWDGQPAEDTAPYAYAKRAILEMGQAYRKQYGLNAVVVIPTNLYGPRDNFDVETGHVIPAMIQKFSEALDGEVVLWGSGKPTRDFLYVTDAARGIVDVVETYDEPEPLNLGTGTATSIHDLATMVAQETGFNGRISWNADRPEGTSYRRLGTSNTERKIGWKATVPLLEGLRLTTDWYRRNVA